MYSGFRSTPTSVGPDRAVIPDRGQPGITQSATTAPPQRPTALPRDGLQAQREVPSQGASGTSHPESQRMHDRPRTETDSQTRFTCGTGNNSENNDSGDGGRRPASQAQESTTRSALRRTRNGCAGDEGRRHAARPKSENVKCRAWQYCDCGRCICCFEQVRGPRQSGPSGYFYYYYYYSSSSSRSNRPAWSDCFPVGACHGPKGSRTLRRFSANYQVDSCANANAGNSLWCRKGGASRHSCAQRPVRISEPAVVCAATKGHTTTRTRGLLGQIVNATGAKRAVTIN
jgi:hypothetical protein